MVDLSKGFFFSYNYSLSYSSQFNILQKTRDCPDCEQSMFVWNHYLLSEFRGIVSSEWYVSLIQGVFLQKHCVQYGHHFQLSLIARRSRLGYYLILILESMQVLVISSEVSMMMGMSQMKWKSRH